MGTALPVTVAAGVLNEPENSLSKCKLPQPAISKCRLGFVLISCGIHVGYSHMHRCPVKNYGSSGLKMALDTWPQSGSSHRSSYAFLQYPPSGWMNSKYACVLHSPNNFIRSFLNERVAPILPLPAGEENEFEDGQVDSDGDDKEDEDIVKQTLNLFEWPAICVQVSQFASTPMGVSIAKDANLMIGANKLQSEELLDQTAAACAIPKSLDFSGIENLEAVIAGAVSGTVCQIKELCSVKNTLIGIQNVYDQLFDPVSTSSSSPIGKSERASPLQILMSDCDLCSDLVHEIDRCLDCTIVTVLDRASPALAAMRISRQENMKALEALLKEAAVRIVQQGGMDEVVMTRRRNRLCIAVRSSHKSLLRGGVVLDVSNSGTTSFMEPEPALILNNEEIRLAGVERAEEIAVLRSLTFKLVDKADLIMNLLGRVTMVDLACARACHATWLGSVRPFFHVEMKNKSNSTVREADRLKSNVKDSDVQSTQEGAYADLMVDILGIRHPLLLGTVLPSLPLSQRYGVVQSFNSPRKSPKPKQARSSVLEKTTILPVPIDIKVHSKVSVVTITGPNTGGKTATLKTFGVAAIMAKAGLFLPAIGQPKLPWFDMVLADIGDEQSLERSLSTFSGHIKRLCGILDLCTDQSLILLDEIGGGTDPSEGAALASAVLHHLLSEAQLTIATTHSAELKTLKDEDPRFENASVEFDIKTLKPTYRVMWGIAGQSNALDIAESLGFDKNVLTRARQMVNKLLPSQIGVRTSEILEPLVKQCNEQLDSARKASLVFSKAQDLHSELKAATDNLPKREAKWRRLKKQTVQSEIASAKLRMEQVIDRFQEAMYQDDSPPLVRNVQAEISSIVEEFSVKQRDILVQLGAQASEGNSDSTSVADPPVLGEKVLVRRLGKAPVTVVELPQKDTGYLMVQLGTLKIQVRSNEVIKTGRTASTATSEKNEKLSEMSYKTSKRAKSQTSDMISSEPKYDVAVQTSRNTLDLRGMRVEDAMRELNIMLASKKPGSVMFVVHGVGTGAVKESAHQILAKHPYVFKFEEESITNQGCTIVYVK